MKEILIRLVTALLGTVGFSILFYIRPRRLVLASIGGVLACGIYLLLNRWIGGEFLPNMIATFIGTVFSEICARRTRVPVSVYITPCMIPLVPGYALYSTMSCLVRADYSGCAAYALTALSAALGIAGGIVAGSVLFLLFRPLKRRTPGMKRKNARPQTGER